MWKCLIDLMWRSLTVYIICGSLIGSDVQSSSDTLHLNFMSISAYFQLRCNRKTYYIIKGERLRFFHSSSFWKKNGTIKCYFFLFEWYLYILKDITGWEDYTDISRILRIIFFILLFVGFSLPGITAVSSPLAVTSSSFGCRQGAHAENFMDLTESQQSQCVLKNKETSLSE